MMNRSGRARYEAFRDRVMADPEYEAEAQKMDVWLALVEARQAAGLTQAELASRLGVSQAQVARLERRGYDSHSLRTLRRYVEALGDGYSVDITIQRPGERVTV